GHAARPLDRAQFMSLVYEPAQKAAASAAKDDDVALERHPRERRRVYILARKILMRNTRIFKQSKSLTDAGYDVTVIGIRPRNAGEREEREGYLLIRLALDPLYASLPRRLRRLRARMERGLRGLPGAYFRRSARVRRRRRLLVMRFKRRRR